MVKNKKTVHRGFSYLQCDDFAAYLSQMAAQGWHFKEWGAGLVFEKGEPEDAVYAVEVFIDGSSYDLRPGDHTLNFADYCDAAGWQLIDAKQKFCIFKQVKTDAVPIVTPEERLRNASKAYGNQLIWQLVLSIIWMFSFLIRFFNTDQLVNTLFHNLSLVLAGYWVFHFLYTVGKILWFLYWKNRAKKQCATGEIAILRNTSEKTWNWISTLALVLFMIAYTNEAGLGAIMLVLGIVSIFLVMALLLSIFRPDTEMNICIQTVVAFMVVIGLVVATLCLVTESNTSESSSETYPLHYADLTVDSGPIRASYSSNTSSILGSASHYSIHYENAALMYELYETEHDWILDMIWEDRLSWARNANPVDCAASWQADTGYHNQIGEYYIRYNDTILILHTYEETLLTNEQIATVRRALGLEG